MRKSIVITFTPEEVAEITGHEIIMDFGTFMNPNTRAHYTWKQIAGLENLLLEFVSKEYADLTAEMFARLYTGSSSAMFKSNQRLVGEVTISFPEISLQ